jgi:putative PIN family toxin of toxin-antitoxin system
VQLALDGHLIMFISAELLAELRDVTSRPKVIAQLGLVAERVDDFLETIELMATVVTGVPERFTYERDPDDALYVNLALAAGAQRIVTRDRDLLDLMDLNKAGSAEFQQQFPLLRILDPVAFLRETGNLN